MGIFQGRQRPQNQIKSYRRPYKTPKYWDGGGQVTPLPPDVDAHETVLKYCFNALINRFSRQSSLAERELCFQQKNWTLHDLSNS